MNNQSVIEHPWTYDSLWAKTKLYVGRAFDVPRDSDMFPFWASLGLEFLVRATLSHTHPALLAAVKDGDSSNLLFAFGITSKNKKIAPKSIDTSEALARCEQVVPSFTSNLREFCQGMTGRRNEELHSGGLPFEGFDNKIWLPRFFAAATALLQHQGKSLVDLIGQQEAAAADKMLAAEADETAKQVKQIVNAHAEVWKAKPLEDRVELAAAAAKAAKPNVGHVVNCPACGSKALLGGEVVSCHEPQIEEGEVVVRENMLPTTLKCEACSLRIIGHNRLHATGMGGLFIRTARFDPVSYYAEDEGTGESPDDFFNE